MGQLRDITTYFNRVHPSSCPCNLSVDKFMSNYHYESKKYDSMHTKEILLVTNIPDDHEDYLMLTKRHFLILSQRYHPDKNTPDHVMTCQITMTTLNQALCAIEENHHKKGDDKSVVVQDGKIYTYRSKEIITCQHYQCVAAYCHPGYEEDWIHLLQHEWSTEPTAIQQGVQFGNNQQSLYITVFNTGTVFVQGNLAISYSLENMARLISLLPKEKKLDSRKRLSALKNAMKLFPIPVYHSTEPVIPALTFETYQPSNNSMLRSESGHDNDMTPTILDKDNTINSIQLNHQFQSMGDTQHEPSLSTALLMMRKLEQKLLSMESDHQKCRREMERRIEKLEKENKELRHTVGPKVSYLLQQPHLQRQQITEDNKTHNPTTSTQSITVNNTNEHQDKRNDEGEWTTVTHGKPTKRKTQSSTKATTNTDKTGSIQFQIEKVVIIENITNTEKANSDDKVRREIGKHIDKVIIDRITHYPHKKSKLMIQVATEEMKKLVVGQWKSEGIFGSSSIRLPTKQIENTVGVAKGVPLDMDDDDLKNDLDQLFSDTTFIRMTKGPTKQKLRAVKIFFKSPEDLAKAIEGGIKLASQSQYVRVEALKWRPHVRHCTNCWRFGHSSTQCESEKACPHCGEGINVSSHLICAEQPTCRNCKGNHSSDQRNECSEFRRRLAKITQRHQELQNGD